MKVSEMIAFLQTCPADAEIETPDGLEITPVLSADGDIVVMTDDVDALFDGDVQAMERLAEGE